METICKAIDMKKLRVTVLATLLSISTIGHTVAPAVAEPEKTDQVTFRGLEELRDRSFSFGGETQGSVVSIDSYRVPRVQNIADSYGYIHPSDTIELFDYTRPTSGSCRSSVEEASESIHTQIQDTLAFQHSESSLSEYLNNQPENQCGALYRYRVKVAEILGIEVPRLLSNGFSRR